jgi:hypothetical protein
MLLAMCAGSKAVAQTRIPAENTLEDLQLFAPVDWSSYGDKPYLKEGLFITHDFLFWSVQRPDAAVVGAPGATRLSFNQNTFQTQFETNAIETGEFEDLLHTGNRTELGYINDCNGWILGHFSLHQHGQEFVHNNAAIVFEDPLQLTPSGFITNRRGVDADFDGDRVYGRDGEDLGTFRATPANPLIQTPGVGTGGVIIVNPIAPVFGTPHPQPDDPGDVGAPGSVGRPPHPANSLGNGSAPGFYLPYDGIPDSLPNGDVPDLGDLVPLPSDFHFVTVRNETDIWGLELMGMRRLEHISYGGHWELMAGVRYVSFSEDYWFEGFGGALGDTNIHNWADNNIIGPQFGARWFTTCCRWTFSSEARFAPSVNFQAVRMRTSVGSHNAAVNQSFRGPITTGLPFQNAGNDSFHEYEFSPVGELRLNLHYQLTRAIAVRAGWTATYIDGLSRPSNMVRYIIPNPTIIKSNNYDDVFMQGINVGLEINR